MNQIYLFLVCAVALACTSMCESPFVWIGAVTASSFTIHSDIDQSVSQVILSTNSDFSSRLAVFDPNKAIHIVGNTQIYGRLRKFTFTDLTPSTLYFIGVQNVSNSTNPIASVRTFPADGVPTDVLFAVSSCQYRASWDSTFADIAEQIRNQSEADPMVPFVMLHMGDLAYSDITANDVSLFEDAIRKVVTRPNIQTVFNSTPVTYMYDDHDYGGNNVDADSPSREAAINNYRTMVPSYPSPIEGETYHAFTVGQVRVVVTDLRSHASKTDETTMGNSQREWFFSELETASQYAVIVWLSTKPWIGDEDSSEDTWRGYGAEREQISNRIAELNVSNLVFVAGDAHMLAADNGSNSDYSTNTSTGAGFPVFQAAPLANVGSSKGGAYTEGCHAYRYYLNKQYGILRITNIKNTTNGPCVEFSGHNSGAISPVLTFRRCGKLGAIKRSDSQNSTCSLTWFPAWVWVVVSIIALWAVAVPVVLILLYRSIRMSKKKADIDTMTTTTEKDE